MITVFSGSLILLFAIENTKNTKITSSYQLELTLLWDGTSLQWFKFGIIVEIRFHFQQEGFTTFKVVNRVYDLWGFELPRFLNAFYFYFVRSSIYLFF